MSKLFDALKNLEVRESGGQETVYPFIKKQGDKGRRKRPVWVVPSLILLFFVAIGLGFTLSMGLLKTGHIGMPVTSGQTRLQPIEAYKNHNDAQSLPAVVEKAPLREDAKAPREPVGPTSSVIVDDKKDVKDNMKSDMGSGAAGDIDMRKTGHLPQKTVSKGERAQKKIGTQDKQDKVYAKVGEGASNEGHEAMMLFSHDLAVDRPDVTNMSVLQRAEEYRAAGRIEEAAELYKTVWNKTGDVKVANNLGAALLVLGRAKEAEDVLAEALKKAPDDMDIKFNLDLAHRKLIQAEHSR